MSHFGVKTEDTGIMLLAPTVRQKAFDLWRLHLQWRSFRSLMARSKWFSFNSDEIHYVSSSYFMSGVWLSKEMTSLISSDTGTSALVDWACSAQSWVACSDTVALGAEGPRMTRRDWRPSPLRSSASSRLSPCPASSLYLWDKGMLISRNTSWRLGVNCFHLSRGQRLMLKAHGD